MTILDNRRFRERGRIMAEDKLNVPYVQYPTTLNNNGFWCCWCCDCGLRHIYFVKIIRGKKPKDDTVQLYIERDDWGTRAGKTIKKYKKQKHKPTSNLNPLAQELAIQCVDFVKNSPKGFEAIPLGYNLEEDMGLIQEAEQALKKGGE